MWDSGLAPKPMSSAKLRYRDKIAVGLRGNHHQWKSIWRGLIPTKVNCFTWLVIRRACLTREVLQKKGMQLVPRCVLRNLWGETNKNPFLWFKFTTQIWELFLNITGFSGTVLEQTFDLFDCWSRRWGKQDSKEVVEANTIMHIVVTVEGKNWEMLWR